MNYLVDSNFLGELATLYPDDVFPSLWVDLETRLFTPSVFFHQEVDDELKLWSHPTYDWYSRHREESQVLRPDQLEIGCYAEVTEWVADVREPRYRAAAVDEFLGVADSWLVASAYRHNAGIVTNEVSAPESVKKVKIPDVASNFGVRCFNTVEFLRKIGTRI